MKRLGVVETEWRNYFYANIDGTYNDIKNFMVRVELISDSHEQIVEGVLKDNSELVRECKEEIMFQKEQLKETITEFIEFCMSNADSDIETDTEEILMDIADNGTSSIFYIVVDDWKNWGNKSNEIWKSLNTNHKNDLNYIHDDLCKLIMQEVYNDIK